MAFKKLAAKGLASKKLTLKLTASRILSSKTPSYVGAIAAAIVAEPDIYFKYTTLLLTGNGTNNAQNNTFLDSSTNTLAITRNGNPSQGTFSPYGGNWSNYFDGTGDYLTTPSSLAMALGSTFTVECWIYVLSWNNSGPTILDVRDSNIVGVMYVANDGTARMQTTATSTIASQTGITLNTWIHVAYVSDATSSRIYVNGSNAGATNQGQAVFPTTAKAGFIGADFSGGYGFNGYISNMRVVKGTAVYTANFTPSATPLTAITNTSLLTCQDNRLIDDSPNNFTITKTGDVSVQRFSPFSPVITTPTTYSAYFDGDGDYLSVPSNLAFAFGTGDFTVECFFNLSIPQSTRSMHLTDSTVTNGLFLKLTSGNVSIGRTGTAEDSVFSYSFSINTWYHVAFSRSGTTVYCFVNGSLVGSTTNSINYVQGGYTIGAAGGAAQPFHGYISNLRMLKGTALYTAAFTTPASPLTAVSGTSLLTCQSPTFIDNSINEFAITASGNSKPTTVNPFGFTNTASEYSTTTFGGSAYFDGTGDYLDTTGSDLALATNAADFTMECWVYNNGYTGSQYGRGIFTYYPSGGYGANRLMFRLDSATNKLNIYLLASSNANFGGAGTLTTGTVPADTWTHVALVRKSGVFYVYINGVLDSTINSSSNASDIPFTTFNMFDIGRTQDGTVPDWNGYISNYRFVKGRAVYTSNFVPPIAPVTAVANTSLLCNFTNAGIIDNAMMNDLETFGDAKISTTQSKFGGSSMSFDGTNDYLTFRNRTNRSIYFSTGNWTVEMWTYYNTTGNYDHTLVGGGPNISFYDLIFGVFNYGSQIGFWNQNGFYGMYASSNLTSGVWRHIAFVRNSDIITLYINGTSVATQAFSAATKDDAANDFLTGVVGQSFNGYIDDLRITKGYARYTSNFTPPTALSTMGA